MKQLIRIVFSLFISIFFSLFLINPVSASADVTYSGAITNGAGIPLYNAQISLVSSTASYSVSTNPDGSFSFLVPPGIYTLSLTTTQVSQSIVPSLTNVTVPNISINSDTVQNLTVPTHILTVTVLNHLGQPVPNVQVAGLQNEIIPAPLYPGGPDVISWGSNINSSAYTNSDGVVDIPLLFSQSLTIYIYPPPGSNLPIIIEPPFAFLVTTSTTVNLPINVTYSGVITNGAGIPLNGAQIELPGPTAHNRVNTGVDGSFVIPIPAGTYSLSIITYNVSQSIVPSFAVNVPNVIINSDTVQNLTVPTQILTVTVLDPNGSLLSNAQVAGVENEIIPAPLYPGGLDTSWGSGINASAFTDTNGIANIPLLLSQSVTLYVYPPSGSNLPILIAQPVTFLGAKSIIISYATPTVEVITAPLDPVPVNTVITASASFFEAAFTAPHGAIWDWGDGTTSSGTVTETNGLGGSVSGSHTYTAAGAYTVNLTVTDKYGASGQAPPFQYLAVYDSASTAGFVTGSGIINSPAGAFSQDLDLTGKVNFGFSVKYQPGGTAPNGGSQFKFRLAGINFSSTSYQWLVISGAKATFKGVGTNNGSGNYTFRVSTIDGAPDKYRIKITDNTTNTIFYDNEMGSPETVDPTTALVVGSVVIH